MEFEWCSIVLQMVYGVDDHKIRGLQSTVAFESCQLKYTSSL
jgi:hypothetical protein